MRISILAAASLVAGPLAISMGAADGVAMKPDPAKEERLKWFHQAKYGLFIHWGLYAIPAGEWKNQRSPGIGEWIMNRMRIPVKEYEKLANQFNPLKFDAEAWVQLAVNAGMRYIVITAKHHDGFAMYHSRVSPYNVYDATPFKRDPIKELSEACARHGMPFGVYYSQVLDWHEPGGGGLQSGRSNDWDFPPNDESGKGGRYERYVREKAVPQVRELLENYGPICVVWFDSPRESRNDLGRLFMDTIRSIQPKTLISGRLMSDGTGGDYFSTGDNAIPAQYPRSSAWEVPATVNQTWGFRKDDRNWKSPGEILFKLVDVASKGGNYLLNVGPDAEGVIPPASQDNLRAVGRWLQINGEAVYGVGRSPFGEEFGEFSARLKNRHGKPVFLAFTDWRCTTNPGKLYFILFHAERMGDAAYFALPAFKSRIKSVYMLDDPKHTPLALRLQPDGTRALTVSRYVNDVMASVLVVEINGERVVR